MPINHPFVSPKADPADATLVRPSNWNAGHVIDQYVDVPQTAVPANPGAGNRRVFMDAADGKLKVRTSAGLSLSLEEQGGGGGVDTIYAFGNSGASPAINWANGNIQTLTMTANATFTFSNPVAGVTYTLRLTQDVTGGRTATWPATVKWSGGIAPTLSLANKIDLIYLFYDGTSYFASANLNY